MMTQIVPRVICSRTLVRTKAASRSLLLIVQFIWEEERVSIGTSRRDVPSSSNDYKVSEYAGEFN